MIEAFAQRLRRATPDRRRAARRTIPRPRLPRPRVLLALAAVMALLGLGWLWVRDSSLVAVNRVSVSGTSGPDAGAIRAALAVAARNMTTLDVQMNQLRTAIAPFPVVKDLRVSVQFPHGMRIQVVEQIPVGVVVVAGRRIAVAGDGTLLHDLPAPRNLATIPLHVPPGGSRLTDRNALDAVELLAAAPDQLLRRVTQVASVAPHGSVAQLRNGPDLYFGDATRSAAKWAAVATVLTDPGAAGAVYVDVTDPSRPAVGGASSSGGASPTASATGSSTGSQTTPTGG